MKLHLQILFLLLTWFTNTAIATPVFTKIVLPSYEVSFSKAENVKEESIVKIGVQNFARSGISENSFSQKLTSSGSYALDGASRAGECKVVQGAGNVLEDVALITSSNASKQARIDKVAEWLRAMGKKNSEINNIISGKIDLSSGISVIELKKGEKIWRFERTIGNIEVEKHFFTTADAADAGVKSVGFADPSGYKLVTFEILENTQVLKTKMNTGYTQYITDKLQNNIKVLLEEVTH